MTAKNLRDWDDQPGPGPLPPFAPPWCAAATSAGRLRSRNEDAWSLPASGADEANFGTLIVVADGVGGLEGGGEASREAVAYLQALYYAQMGTEHLGDRLRECVEAVNALNRLESARHPNPGAWRLTTLVAAVLAGEHLWVANVGDSRAYLVQAANRQRRQLTEDHSGQVRAAKAGLAGGGDLDPRANGLITRAVGLSDSCQVDLYHYTWSEGDALILCTDGLSSLDASEVSEITLGLDAAEAARALVEEAVARDGSDNCTAIVARCLPRPEAGADSAADAPQDPQALKTGVPTLLTPPAATAGPTLGRRPEAFAPASQAVSPPPPEPKPGAGTPERTRRTAGRLLLGILLGWLSAALVFIFLLARLGFIRLF